MPDRKFLTLIIHLCTLIVLIGIAIMLARALPVLTHAAHIYVTMYG